MSHSDICNTSYGRKKGRESNWQFDSQPQKVKNQPDPSVCKWSATHHWKTLKESYKLASNLILIRGLSQELWAPKVPRVQPECRNPSFGLATKAKGLQRCGPRGSPGATSYTSGSVGKCEGVNPHIPRAIPTLGYGVSVDSRNFKEQFEGSKLNGLCCPLYYWKAFGT
jgi:hypothetical protein